MASTYSLTGTFTSKAKEAFLNMMRGGSEGASWHPAFIDVGTGGDLDLSGADTGARVAPVDTETEIRKRLFRANIVYTETLGDNKIKYTAFVDGHESLSTDINEFALVGANQVMIAHLVLPVGAGTRATKYEKTPYAKLFLEWVVNISLVV